MINNLSDNDFTHLLSFTSILLITFVVSIALLGFFTLGKMGDNQRLQSQVNYYESDMCNKCTVYLHVTDDPIKYQRSVFK